ncbi:S-adenosyl-L-methionine-dependent methyltransferase [Dichotomocladium elegans]|nr:S-adenosyl-L-methionine-dependent methyltransferase [Dichotomocladium elegans]
MGNQQSRPRSPSTVSHTTNYPQEIWSPQNPSRRRNPYTREYPLPLLIPSEGRVKLRKNSSPSTMGGPAPAAAAAAAATAEPGAPVFQPASSSTRSRSRFKPLRALSSFRLDSTVPPAPSSLLHHTPAIGTCKTIAPPEDDTSTLPSVHPLVGPEHLVPIDENVWINGRRYSPRSTTYLLPCDEDEVCRLHLLHFMVRFAIQGNYLAPVSDVLRKGGKVLDVGCGPGAWSMEIAGEYPKSQIIGVDLCAMYPTDIKPTNCTFHQRDVLDGLPFEDESFDYVFMRFIGLGIQREQWTGVLRDLVRVLKPGGWIELAETDAELYRAGPRTREMNQEVIQVMELRHIDPAIGRTLKDHLGKMDELTNMQTTFISCPGGQWAGKLGQLTLQSWQAYYQALGPKVCRVVNKSVKEYEEGLKLCWAEADEHQTFENVHFAYAQKRLPS